MGASGMHVKPDESFEAKVCVLSSQLALSSHASVLNFDPRFTLVKRSYCR